MHNEASSAVDRLMARLDPGDTGFVTFEAFSAWAGDHDEAAARAAWNEFDEARSDRLPTAVLRAILLRPSPQRPSGPTREEANRLAGRLRRTTGGSLQRETQLHATSTASVHLQREGSSGDVSGSVESEQHSGSDCAIDALAQMLAQLQSLSHISNHQPTKTSQERRLNLIEKIIAVLLSMKRQVVGEGDADVEAETAELHKVIGGHTRSYAASA